MEFLETLYQAAKSFIEEIQFRLYHGPIFHRFLNHKYTYYRRLPWKMKIPYLKLVRDHYRYFDFVERDIKLTRAMKAIICCAAAQLVMYLPSESLTFFERIIVYRDYYNSKITHKRHKGEVNPGMKIIVFSWRGIQEGLDRDDDGLNLLLHEFAHALWLEHKLMRHIYTVLNTMLVKQFERLAQEEMAQLQADENHFFRKYAFENIEEFFAVAVENFFERPKQFNDQLPHFYEVLSAMFGQNPIQYLPAEPTQ
jgi:Mlc titration factor MtfA (ptsG expression regulator)